MPRAPRSRAITVFLLRDGPAEPARIFKRLDELVNFSVRSGDEQRGMLYVQPSYTRPPSWLSFFRGAVEFDGVDAYNASTSAVWLTEAAGRLFAVTFGYGRNLLRPDSWEEDFGLRVTLNAVDKDRIRTVDRMTLDAISQQSRIQASHDASISEFGLDVEQDLLRAVTGVPERPALGVRLTGRDALHANLRAELRDIPQLLARYMEEYQREDYKVRFPWVAQIHEVTDPIKKAELDIQLVQKLRAGELERMWLAPPEILDWENLAGFKYRTARTAAIYPDIHVRAFLESCNDPLVIDEYALKQRSHVYLFGADNETIVNSWSIYRCLYCEVHDGNNLFLLNNARWFRIASDFVERIADAVERIPQNVLQLPAYRDRSEGSYCARIAAEDAGRFALMDRRLVTYAGLPSSVEFCDIYSVNRQMVHLKRYSGSSTLSHLFAQGVVSARLFLSEAHFRDAVNGLLPDTHRLPDPQARPRPDEYEVVYGIISLSARELVLPFFSRVNLKNAWTNLTSMGYRVSVSKIAANLNPD